MFSSLSIVNKALPCIGPTRALVTLAALTALLAGCGGSGSDAPIVNSVSVGPNLYGRPAAILVQGLGLNQGVTVTADKGCDTITESANGDNLTRRFTCTLSAVGTLTFRVRSLGGRELANVQVAVPQPQVTLTVDGLGTDGQTIVMTLDPDRAPLSVNNVLAYVNAGFYDGVIFHRADPANGVVQTGGYTPGPTFKAPTRNPIALESANGLKNLRGTVGMARSSAPDSATAQFYFNVRDNPGFDYQSAANPGYAVFGSITRGLEVMDAIFAEPTGDATLLDKDGNALNGPDGQPFVLSTVPTRNIVVRTARQTR